MKKTKPIILWLSILVLACQTKTTLTNMENTETIVFKLKAKYAPDKRTAIFDIAAEEENESVTLTGETNLPEAHAKLIKSLERKKIDFSDRITILPAADLGEKYYGIIRISVANLRSRPAHSAELATQALLGTVVNVYKKDRYWYLVQTPDNYLAWVDASALTLVDQAGRDRWITTEKLFVTADYGFAYQLPGEDAPRVSDIVAGDLLQLETVAENYYQVRYPDGRQAFIATNDGQKFSQWIKSARPAADPVIATARRYRGLPYQWGGTSSKSMDCSGFTKTVFYLNGLILPRDASQQVFTGKLVDEAKDFSKLKPGDLLFFGITATDSTRERITHVGIYLGDTEFIHASGLVKINSLDSTRANFNKYRYDNYIRTKRIIPKAGKNGTVMVKDHPYYFQ